MVTSAYSKQTEGLTPETGQMKKNQIPHFVLFASNSTLIKIYKSLVSAPNFRKLHAFCIDILFKTFYLILPKFWGNSFPFLPRILRHSFWIGEIWLKDHYDFRQSWIPTLIVKNPFHRHLIWISKTSKHTTFSVSTQILLDYIMFTSRFILYFAVCL